MSISLIIILSLVFSAFFSGSEIAFISSNKLKIEVDKNKGLLSGRILSELNKFPTRFIGAMLLGNNIALVIFGISMAEALDPLLVSTLPLVLNTAFWILLIQTLVSTMLILVVGEFIPKALFRINPNSILRVIVFPAYLFYILFYPVIFFFTSLSESILKKLFRVRIVHEEYTYTTVDLDNYIKEFTPSPQSEIDMGPEILMFQNAIEFKRIRLRECMVPRTEIVAMEDTDSIETLKQLHIETGHSKILIFHDSIDHIVGYTHSFDLFKDPQILDEILKPIPIVPESMLANTALQMLIRERKSVAVVLDEFGGTAGIVTTEDIIEEIFGEIKDEFDVDHEIEKQIGKDEFIFSGRLEIDYLNEKYKLKLPESEDYETLAGLIIHYHESIPDQSDEILVDPFVFTILQATENRIDQVQLKFKE
ncbi:MAG: hemolysin family protein [Bacteroidota bacterium]